METVEKNKKVSISYSLKDENGKIIEEVPKTYPFVYMQGCDSVIEGLEDALEGHHIGDHVIANIPYNKGYGPYRSDLIVKVPKQELYEIGELWLGMELEWIQKTPDTEISIPEDPHDIYAADNEEDDPPIYVIREIQKDFVILDGNHPFAGKDLTFDIHIIDISDASATELETGVPDEYEEDEEDDLSDDELPF